MAQFELVMPKMGESIAEATIIRWLKNEGDRIEADEPVLEIATDKVDSEVPATQAGFLVKKLFKENDVVPVGSAVAIISQESGNDAQNNAPVSSAPATKAEPVDTAVKQVTQIVVEQVTPHSESHRFYSPLVKNIAKTEGLSSQELSNVAGTGKDGRVTKRDILAFLENKSVQPEPIQSKVESTEIVESPKAESPKVSAKSNISVGPGDEIIEMDRMRKLIAEHMVMSKSTSPHVTSFVEADVTNLVIWREKIKSQFEKKEGEKITFTPIFIECLVKAIKDFPMINISLDGDKIIKRKNINIGMAAALPTGNLIVPVIRQADTKNLIGLTREVNDLANRARQNKLSPDDIQGGTYTITNVGTFGNVMGTPIINQPQVAIMATGAIRKKPAVIETEYGDVIAVRHMMFLSHSYDHRIVDGALGGSFVRRFADYLENWDVNREI